MQINIIDKFIIKKTTTVNVFEFIDMVTRSKNSSGEKLKEGIFLLTNRILMTIIRIYIHTHIEFSII